MLAHLRAHKRRLRVQVLPPAPEGSGGAGRPTGRSAPAYDRLRVSGIPCLDSLLRSAARVLWRVGRMARSSARDAENFARLLFETVERLGASGEWVPARQAFAQTVADHPEHPYALHLDAKPARRTGLATVAERLRAAEFPSIERRKAGRRATRRSSTASCVRRSPSVCSCCRRSHPITRCSRSAAPGARPAISRSRPGGPGSPRRGRSRPAPPAPDPADHRAPRPERARSPSVAPALVGPAARRGLGSGGERSPQLRPASARRRPARVRGRPRGPPAGRDRTRCHAPVLKAA